MGACTSAPSHLAMVQPTKSTNGREDHVSAKTPEDILGFEYDWLAVDKDGHLGLFSTAGGGRAPQTFLADTDAHDAGLDALMASPPTTSARFFRQSKTGLDNAWKNAAERGVFAFDSDPSGAPYRLVAAPKAASTIDGVPAITAQAGGRVKLDHLCFADVREGEIVTVET